MCDKVEADIHTFLYFILGCIIYHVSPDQYSIGDVTIYVCIVYQFFTGFIQELIAYF